MVYEGNKIELWESVNKRMIVTTINPYISFSENCEEAFDFCKSIFGGEFPYVGKYKDMP